MCKTIIFGNSGSGKSTLARKILNSTGAVHLDLDTLAWQAVSPPLRKPLTESTAQITQFIHNNNNWVIEGCYTELLQIAKPYATDIIFMNLHIDQCIENARNRPWEPHKYPSKEAQDSNLTMLIDWIKQYNSRDDEFSFQAHKQFYNQFDGKKIMHTENT